MAKFEFRLEKLLEVRRRKVDEAKAEYLQCVARKLEGEQQVDSVKDDRVRALRATPSSLEERRALEGYLNKLDDDQRAAESVVAVLTQEEGSALAGWMQARQEVEALEKLRAREEAVWKQIQARKEQGELDEWSTTRRAA